MVLALLRRLLVGVIVWFCCSLEPFHVHAFPSNVVAILGTENGYNSGGTEELCWLSTYALQNPDVSNSAELNRGFVDSFEAQNSSSTLELLPRCFPSTHLIIEREDHHSESETTLLFMERVYNFTIDVTVNLTTIPRNTEFFVHLRLQVCDALRYGSCNPIQAIHHDLFHLDDFQQGESNSTSVDMKLVTFQNGGQIGFTEWTTWPFLNDTHNGMLERRVISSIRLPPSIRRGTYFVVAHAFVAVQAQDTVVRLDISQSIPEKVIEVRMAPMLKEVSVTTKTIIGVAIGIFGCFGVFLFTVIIVYRDHVVMKLSQGPFLAAIVAGCLIQIVFSFILIPSRDIHCRFSGILMLIPMTFVASCIVGRIWRVYRTLSTVNKLGRHDERSSSRSAQATGDSVVSALTSIARFRFRTRRKDDGPTTVRRHNGLRQAVSAKETATLVFALTIPQIVLQVVAAALEDSRVVLRIDPTGTVQRPCCEGSRWSFVTGLIYGLLVFIIAMWLAWMCRDLPSIFNEKGQVYGAASLCVITAIVTVVFHSAVEDSGTNADLAVLLPLSCSIIIPMSVLAKVVFPKVRRVLSGEKVVMSNIIGGKFSATAAPQPSDLSSTETALRPAAMIPRPPEITEESRRVSLQEHDPLPPQVEVLLFEVQRMLHGINGQITQGRAPPRQDLTQLEEEIGLLSRELVLIDFVKALQSKTEAALNATQDKECFGEEMQC